jgi:Zn-dependent protease with chaperone function
LIPAVIYLDFFRDFFSSPYVEAGLVAGISVLFFCYLGFVLSRGIGKSRFLISISVVSTSLWIFVLSSLAFCMMLVGQYWTSPGATILLVAKLALASSAFLGVSSMLVFRKHALSTVYRSIQEQSIIEEDYKNVAKENPNIGHKLLRSFRDLTAKISQIESPPVLTIKGVLLSSHSILPPSLAFDWHNTKLIAIKENVAEMLDDDELEAVIAHELGHIKHRDALQKSIATAYRVAFPFDIVARLTEAAVYRRRELEADDFSARTTKKPVALASALLKIYENIQIKPHQSLGQISYLVDGSHKRRSNKRLDLFSKEPPLRIRIDRLLHTDSQ